MDYFIICIWKNPFQVYFQTHAIFKEKKTYFKTYVKVIEYNK